jgi:hypothetical protein
MMTLCFVMAAFMFGLAAGYAIRSVHIRPAVARHQRYPEMMDDDLFFYDYDIGRTHD